MTGDLDEMERVYDIAAACIDLSAHPWRLTIDGQHRAHYSNLQPAVFTAWHETNGTFDRALVECNGMMWGGESLREEWAVLSLRLRRRGV